MIFKPGWRDGRFRGFSRSMGVYVEPTTLIPSFYEVANGARWGSTYRGVVYTFCSPWCCVVLLFTIRDKVGCNESVGLVSFILPGQRHCVNPHDPWCLCNFCLSMVR
jgi:hypothetical protein